MRTTICELKEKCLSLSIGKELMLILVSKRAVLRLDGKGFGKHTKFPSGSLLIIIYNFFFLKSHLLFLNHKLAI